MKIIHFVLGKANPERMNGVNKVVHNLASYQADLGYEVWVWGITFNPTKNYPKRSYSTRLFPAIKNKFHLHKSIEDAILLMGEKVVVHIHGGFIPEFFHLSGLLKKHQKTFIFTAHGSYNSEALKKNKLIKRIYFTFFERKLLKRAHALHFIGQSEVDHIAKLVRTEKNHLIPNGQNLRNLRFRFKKLNFNKPPIFGFCGRIKSYTKGLDLLLEGFAKYIHTYEGNGELWILGDGEDFKELKSKVDELNIQSNVKLFGSKYGEEKLNLIANMDMFCLTSRYEGLPTAVLEAAALKVPSIVSVATNMAGYIKEYNAGIVLKENNAHEIALAMQSSMVLKYKGELKRMGSNARNMIEKKFDWEEISKQLVHVYAICLRENKIKQSA